MTVSNELVSLIDRLRRARSRRARLRLLFEAWGLVSDLSPSDRLAVARELGFDGAERLVEEIARRRGVDPAPFVEVLGGVERSAGDQVDDVIRGLADPTRRAGTVDRLFEEAGRWAAGLEVPSHPEPAQADDAATAASLGNESAPSGVGSAEAEPPDAAAPPIPPTAAPVVPAPAIVEGVAAAPGPAPGTAPPPEVDEAAGRLIGELTAEPRLVSRLRRLAGAAGQLAEARRGGLAAVLECFPAGWARRRALERLFARGVPRSTADAIALLGALARPSERMWAATALAASRPLDDGERAALLAAVPSPALRRRLSRRLGDRRG